ncbi:MAG: hypothetical protein KJO11_15280 [Gemmatimonadetes bacterium]|nr:hypothetical protein [Gemmatimonadota bacterium]
MTDHEEALIDRPDAVDTTCPDCHHETGLPRGAEPVLPGGLRLDEFRVLVRNEWRRRLGPDAYGRSHVGRIAATLADLAADPESAGVDSRTVRDTYVRTAREALDDILDYPPPSTIPT